MLKSGNVILFMPKYFKMFVLNLKIPGKLLYCLFDIKTIKPFFVSDDPPVCNLSMYFSCAVPNISKIFILFKIYMPNMIFRPKFVDMCVTIVLINCLLMVKNSVL